MSTLMQQLHDLGNTYGTHAFRADALLINSRMIHIMNVVERDPTIRAVVHRTPANEANFDRFAEYSGSTTGQFKAGEVDLCIINKHFCVFTKLVDGLMDPDNAERVMRPNACPDCIKTFCNPRCAACKKADP